MFLFEIILSAKGAWNTGESVRLSLNGDTLWENDQKKKVTDDIEQLIEANSFCPDPVLQVTKCQTC